MIRTPHKTNQLFCSLLACFTLSGGGGGLDIESMPLIRPTVQEDLYKLLCNAEAARMLALLPDKLPLDIVRHVATFLVSPYNPWLKSCLIIERLPIGPVATTQGRRIFNKDVDSNQRPVILGFDDTSDGRVRITFKRMGQEPPRAYTTTTRATRLPCVSEPDTKHHASNYPSDPTKPYSGELIYLTDKKCKLKGAGYTYFPGSSAQQVLFIDRTGAALSQHPAGSVSLPITPKDCVSDFGAYEHLFQDNRQNVLRLPSGWEIVLGQTNAATERNYTSVSRNLTLAPLMTRRGWILFGVSCPSTDDAGYVIANINASLPPLSPYTQLQLSYYLYTGRGVDKIPAAFTPFLPQLRRNARFFAGHLKHLIPPHPKRLIFGHAIL